MKLNLPIGILAAFVTVSFSVAASAQTLSSIPKDVPLRPDPDLTPGSLCNTGKTLRYSEHIRYCERKVSGGEKDDIFEVYSKRYHLQHYDRHQFKMDHYISLCMGGSNEDNNLWPQHLSISAITDRIEALLCQGMNRGKLKQSAAVQMIQQAKHDLNFALKIEPQLQEAYGP